MMATLFQVAAGGALGATLRFLVNATALRLFGAAFPLGTLTVNVAGSVLMGLCAALLLERSLAPQLAPFLMTGVLGGFTTFSAFSLDAIALAEQGEAVRAVIYVCLSVAVSLLGLFAGLAVGRGF
jgi:CrcB protein